MTVDQPVTLTLNTADAYGNACTQGGDQVLMGLQGPSGTDITAAAVEDLSNGSYSITFSPDLAGKWTVKPRQGHQTLLFCIAVLMHVPIAWNLTQLQLIICCRVCRFLLPNVVLLLAF